MCYGHEWGWTLSGNRWFQSFIWNNRKENLHCLRSHSAKMLLAKRILDDVKQKWRSKEAPSRRTLCFHLACEQAHIWASEASRAKTRERALASPLAPLARLLFTTSPKWRALSYASLHSLVKQLNYQSESVLIGATNGNRSHSTRSAHWTKYNFISKLTRTRVREAKILYAREKKCSKCHEFNETVKHIISGCPELAEKPHLYWHNKKEF